MDGKSARGNDEPDIRKCERRKIAVRISRAQQERPSETNEPGARQNKHTHTHTHTLLEEEKERKRGEIKQNGKYNLPHNPGRRQIKKRWEIGESLPYVSLQSHSGLCNSIHFRMDIINE